MKIGISSSWSFRQMMTSKGSIRSHAMMMPFRMPFILSAEVQMMNPVIIQKRNEEINATQGSFIIAIGVTSKMPAPIHKRIPRRSFFIQSMIR